MKAPEPPRADPEGGAELGVHMRLVAIAEVRRQQRERRLRRPQREAQPGQAPQPLERAERHAGLVPERLGDVHRVPVGDARQLGERPAAHRLVRDRLDHIVDPPAAVARPTRTRLKLADDLRRQRGEHQVLRRVGGKLERQLVDGHPGRARTHALDLGPGERRVEMEAEAGGSGRPELVVMRLPGAVHEIGARGPLAPAASRMLDEAAGDDDAHIIVDVPVRRNAVLGARMAEAHRLAAGGTRRDHAVGDAEAQRAAVICHEP
jgi:hypothetical protein